MKVTQELSPGRVSSREDLTHPLLQASSAEIDAWLLANVNTLSEVRTVLKLLIRWQRNTMRRLAASKTL